MICLWRPKKIAELLDVAYSDLEDAVAHKHRFCRECTLHDVRPGGKDRDVLVVSGKLRLIQDRFYKRVLLKHLAPSEYSFGGVRGRSIKDNAAVHLGNSFLFVADISNFYPSIGHRRVFRFFRESLNWPEATSRICTELCTYDHHLALGLVTSPILADQILKPIDAEIAAACKVYHVTYSRYVDDITLSASFDIADTPLCGVIREILEQNAFKVKT